MSLATTLARLNARIAVKVTSALGPSFMPFADVATPDLTLARLFRLSLFQVSCGMAVVLLIGTLNRVMIVELGVPAWLVSVMVALPLIFAPIRALIGHKSDNHRSVLGWKRVPYLYLGTGLQFGGLAIMPFALLVLSEPELDVGLLGHFAAGLAFLMVGAGMHSVQTMGMSLATDLTPAKSHPRVVTMMCTMLLVGMLVSAGIFSLLLANFSAMRLIQVVQGAAVVTLFLNLIAVWKQEARDPSRTRGSAAGPRFLDAWLAYAREPGARRRLIAGGMGTMAFSMQDILLEPYGGEILGLPVAVTTGLTAVLAIGGLAGFLISGRALARGIHPGRLAAIGVLVGVAAFTAVIFADPLQSGIVFAGGIVLIGLGAALFEVSMLTAAMRAAAPGQVGLALGAWGAVQSFCAGSAIALGGIIRDVVASFAEAGALGETLMAPAVGYSFVYHIEVYLLLVTLVAIGPLVRSARKDRTQPSLTFGTAEAS